MIAAMKSPAALCMLAALALAGCKVGGGDSSANAVATTDPADRQPVDQPHGLLGYALDADDFVFRSRRPTVDTVVYGSDDGFRPVEPAPQMPVFDGRTGEPMTGRTLQALLEAADVILLGEIHDDAAGHILQSRLVSAALPGEGGGALAMEMLDRGDAEQFGRDLLRGRNLQDTGLADWQSWREFYLPSIQAARAAGRPIVASNAPREYAVTARLAGYEALAELDPESRQLFELPPDNLELPAYRERFAAAMGSHGDDPDIDGYYDAQLLWDATMADSIADAHARYGGPVVHLNGSFHSDFDGGLTSLLRQRGLKVLTVSLVPSDAQRLAATDAGRARVVIYTGERPPTTRPATQPADEAEPFARVAPEIGLEEPVPTTEPATQPLDE